MTKASAQKYKRRSTLIRRITFAGTLLFYGPSASAFLPHRPPSWGGTPGPIHRHGGRVIPVLKISLREFFTQSHQPRRTTRDSEGRQNVRNQALHSYNLNHNNSQSPFNHDDEALLLSVEKLGTDSKNSTKQQSDGLDQSSETNDDANGIHETMEWLHDQEERRQEMQYGILGKTTSQTLRMMPSFPTNFAAWSSSLQNTTTKAVEAAKDSKNLTASNSRFLNLQPNDTLTVGDLDAILRANGYVRSADLKETPTPLVSNRRALPGYGYGSDRGRRLVEDLDSTEVANAKRKSSRSSVAFPQPSVLNQKSLQRGTTLAGGVVGMVLGTTILPNLWLMGMLFGGIYGYEITRRDHETPPTHIVARYLIIAGRSVAKAALQLYDYWQTLWFLYKTGELSYEYYKNYASLDQRFAIQAKVDAWNARFVEGKMRFDAWEKENEIGRTILAGMRTIWLVDERAKRKAKQTSRYRLVQYIYDLKYWVGRSLRKFGKFLRQSDHAGWWEEFLEGVRKDMRESGWDALGTRLGAVVMAWIAVNITGALFAISPTFLTVMAVAAGIVWPSWVTELVERFKVLSDEIRARGRGDEYTPSPTSSLNTAKLLGRYDKRRYSYYKKPDGSRRYYRSGQSLFGRKHATDQGSSTATGTSSALSNVWPWARNEKKRRPPGKDQWGIFGKDQR